MIYQELNIDVRLRREVEDLEAEKRNSARIFQEINDKILSNRNRLDSLNLYCERISTKGSAISEKNENRGRCKTL
jgi:hypothetical protein